MGRANKKIDDVLYISNILIEDVIQSRTQQHVKKKLFNLIRGELSVMRLNGSRSNYAISQSSMSNTISNQVSWESD